MGSWLKDKFKSFRLVTSKTVDTLITKAVQRAVTEERRWHEQEDRFGDSFPHGSEDPFFLYQETTQPKLLPEKTTEGKEKEKDSPKRVVEAFIGGATAWEHLFATEQSVDELWTMQRAVLNKYFSDPHLRSIIDNWTNYTIGGGIKIHIENDKVNKVITNFRTLNSMPWREKQLVRMFFMEGELYIAYYIDKVSGIVEVRRVRPWEITDIETHTGDIETRFSFHWQYDLSPEGTSQEYKKDKWIEDIDYQNYLIRLKERGKSTPKSKKRAKFEKNVLMQQIKGGIDVDLRGRVPTQPVLRFLKYYEDWLIDRIRLNHERAKVVWIKEIKGRSAEGTTRERRSPKGGIMLIETDDVKYRIESAQLNADDAKEDGMQILYAIGAGTNLPIHILNQRTDQSVYASIRKSDTPFSQFIRSFQEFFALHFERMYRQVIETAIDARKLPKKIMIPTYTQETEFIKVLANINRMVTEGVSFDEVTTKAIDMLKPLNKTEKKILTIDVPISLEFPEIIREDLEAQAKVFKIHKELGIVSNATLAARVGYNWQQELFNMNIEKSMGLEPEKEPTKEPEEPSSDE